MAPKSPKELRRSSHCVMDAQYDHLYGTQPQVATSSQSLGIGWLYDAGDVASIPTDSLQAEDTQANAFSPDHSPKGATLANEEDEDEEDAEEELDEAKLSEAEKLFMFQRALANDIECKFVVQRLSAPSGRWVLGGEMFIGEQRHMCGVTFDQLTMLESYIAPAGTTTTASGATTAAAGTATAAAGATTAAKASSSTSAWVAATDIEIESSQE